MAATLEEIEQMLAYWRGMYAKSPKRKKHRDMRIAELEAQLAEAKKSEVSEGS